MRVVVGLGSGIGNVVFMLPALRELAWACDHVTVYADTDYEMSALLRRCRYIDQVVSAPAPVPAADLYRAGHWCPTALRAMPALRWARWRNEPDYWCAEWQLPFHEWPLPMPEVPETVDWCRDVDRRTKRLDVAIVPGGKPGRVWARKRYPHMAQVARALSDGGLRVVWVGQPDDWQGEVPCGESRLGQDTLAGLPDTLAACRVVVGTDSGPTHLAASLGVPTVIVYTATSLAKGAPVGTRTRQIGPSDLSCAPCQATPRWMACNDWICAQTDPAVVVGAALDFLKEG